MGWLTAIKYAKGSIEKHSHATLNSTNVVIPMRAKVGSLLNIGSAPFVRALIQGSLLTDAGELKNVVLRAISRVKLDVPGRIFRFYTETGDGSGQKETFIQVFEDDSGAVVETLFCRGLVRITPGTADEQIAFTGEAGYGLGEKTYCLNREQLAGLGYDSTTLDTVFSESDVLEYTRDAGDPSAEFVCPFKGTETRLDDNTGEHGINQNVVYMPYVRSIGDQKEYLLIMTEIVNSVDGDSTKREIHVDIMLGINIETDRILIQ